MFNFRKSSRTYSLTPYTGVGLAPPNAVGVDPAAVAAAASVSQSRSNSMSSNLSSAGKILRPVFSSCLSHYQYTRLKF